MAGSLNKVMLIGNLGADPEIRSFQNGGKVANLRIATSETWKDRNTGERQERTEWHTVAIFSEGLVGVVERFLRKGSKVYIEGQLQTRKWQDQSGNDRYSTEVVIRGMNGTLTMLDGASGGGNRIQIGQGDTGLFQHGLDHRREPFGMGTRGDFRHDPAIGCVFFILRRDALGNDLPLAVDQRNCGFIATGFYAEDYGHPAFP